MLSKTLQTFLSKYLSDVDVEGIALPSLYDNSSSGWGVRLRHVKLREGVQLLEELPGKLKLKRKRKRKRKQKGPKKNTSKAKGSSSEKETIASTVKIQPKPAETVPETVPVPKDGASLKPKTLFEEDEKSNPALDDASLELQDLNMNVNESVVYYTDDENSVGSARPQTPVQDSKSLFSCFYNSKSNNLHMHRVSSHGETKSGKVPTTIDTDAVDPARKTDAIEEHSEAQSHDSYKQSLAGAEREDKTEPLGEEEDEEEEDEYEEYEQPMKLRLGQGGRIGTLDVRLIGKDLHILAEDAFLTIEVVPITEKDGEEDGEESEDTDTGGKSSSNIPKAAPAPAAAPTKEPSPETKRSTVGERVLADIALARALSAVPHLFLRDVRIRLIIREEAGADTLPPEHANPNDTVIEVGIDFLSVSSGDDVLSHFQQRQQEEESNSNFDDEIETSRHAKPPMNSIPSLSSVESTVRDENEYIFRHIRTGRGPEGGIWLKVFAPTHRLPARLTEDVNSSPKWARQFWFLETDYHLFRMSGLDLQARIHLGTKKEEASYAWFYGDYDEEGEEDDEYTLDSMFWGVDHIAPGPQLPLPPIVPHMSRGGTPQRPSRAGSIDETAFVSPDVPLPEELLNAHLGADMYITDKNGIQSSKVRSNFHRISRGMVPGSCRNYDHLPCESCPQCWEAPDGIDRDSSLDSSLPMPGLVLQITLRDPLEINADRASLETIGLIQSLFRKKISDSPSDDKSSEDANAEANEKENNTPKAVARDEGTQPTVSTSIFSGFLSRRSKEKPKEDSSEAFSPYMQPENIQVMGLHLSEVTIRIHVLRKGGHNEEGLSFCYWDLSSHCITMDRHSLLSKEKIFQDLRFDIGSLTLAEMRGTERKPLISLGIQYPERNRCDSMASVASMTSVVDDFDNKRAPWPSTACALLAVPPPLETLVYKKRECHGLQMRFISLDNPTDEVVPTRSLLDVRLGVTTISMQWALRLEMSNVRQEIMSTIFDQGATKGSNNGKNEGPKDQATESASSKSQNEDVPETPRPKSLMKYKVQIDSGAISLPPLISLNLPLTQLAGERSTESGLFLESVLQRLEMSYGQVDPSSTLHGKCLSLQQMAALPESLRMRILLLLDDLGPLEEALQLKKGSNSFLQCRSVNKGLLKMAKKVSKSSKSSRRKQVRKAESSTNTRRHELMTEFLKLDDDELEEMWSSHQKILRKLAKRRASVTEG